MSSVRSRQSCWLAECCGSSVSSLSHPSALEDSHHLLFRCGGGHLPPFLLIDCIPFLPTLTERSCFDLFSSWPAQKALNLLTVWKCSCVSLVCSEQLHNGSLLSLQGTTCTAVNGVRSKLALPVLCCMSGVLFLELYFSVLLSYTLLCPLPGQFFCWNSGFVLDSKASKTQPCLCRRESSQLVSFPPSGCGME